MEKNNILQLLKKKKPHIEHRFSVNSIGLFGSCARNSMHSRSDIDILVSFSEPSFDHYMDLKFYLEDLFGRPVDLVMQQTVKRRLQKVIQQDTLYV